MTFPGNRLAHGASISLLAFAVLNVVAVGQEVQGGDEAAPPATDTATTALPEILDAAHCQAGRGLLPEELLRRYCAGEWAHPIHEVPDGRHLHDPDFIAAGEKNAGRYRIGPNGGIVDAESGKQPPFIFGPPFPEIDPEDLQAGTKIVWNFFYQSYSLGNVATSVRLDWVGTGGLERNVVTDVSQRVFDGQPPRWRPEENPQNFLFQQHTVITHPADLQGTVSLTHRFRDPEKRDQIWTYVPALRRVRAVSPVNRSDGFLGSDMSQDDGSYFDGKPEDFTWKLIGEGEMLMLYDRTTLIDGEHTLEVHEDGSASSVDSKKPRFRYQIEEASGLPWAPLQSRFVLVKRPVWIVEGVPKDRYYLYGKIVLRFDKESWRGLYNSKYDWKGELLNTFFSVYGPFFQVGNQWRWYAAAQLALAQNWKMNRATTQYANPDRPRTRSRVPLPDYLFSVDALSRVGK